MGPYPKADWVVGDEVTFELTGFRVCPKAARLPKIAKTSRLDPGKKIVETRAEASTSQTASMADLKPQPYTFDLGYLLCNDSNPLPSVKGLETKDKEAILASTAQGCAQALINQLLTSCPINKSSDDGSLQLKLPAPETALPREKPVPKDKEKSKWEKFAEKKGIQKKRRDGKLVYDEAKGDWVPKYGYKGKNVDGDGDWLVEVDEKAEAAGQDPRQNGRKKAKKGR